MFLDELKADKALYRKVIGGKRMSKKEQGAFDDLRKRHNIRDDGTVATQEDLAELLGKTRQTIIRWKKDGMPIEDGGGYDPVRVIEWRGSDIFGDDEESDDNKAFWDIEYRKFKARLAELEYNKAVAKVIDRAAVEQLLVERATELKKSLMSRSRRLSLRLANKEAEQVQAVLDEDTLEILQAYSRPNGLVKPEEEEKDESEAEKD